MNFNLQDYETVEERLRRFWAAHPQARIITINHTTEGDRNRSQWVVEARIYFDEVNHIANTPKGTGWAFEADGAGMANKTSALENCETSAIGRALANIGFSGNKRASREEMQKVARGAQRNWLSEAQRLMNDGELNLLRMLYNEAKQNRVSAEILEGIAALGQSGNANTGGLVSGTSGANRAVTEDKPTQPAKVTTARGSKKS